MEHEVLAGYEAVPRRMDIPIVPMFVAQPRRESASYVADHENVLSRILLIHQDWLSIVLYENTAG